MAMNNPFSKIPNQRTCRMVLHGWRENRLVAYRSNARRVFFFVGRCVRLGENPISDVARKQICETRTVSEREYKVTVNR